MDYQIAKQIVLDCLKSVADARGNDDVQGFVKMVEYLTAAQFHDKETYDKSEEIAKLLNHIISLLQGKSVLRSKIHKMME